MLLALLGGTMVTSIGLSNVVWVLLVANWLLEGRWREKWAMARESRLLQAVVALFVLHGVGLLWTSNLGAGLHVMERLLPLLAVPMVALTSTPVRGKALHIILHVYVLTVFVVTLIGLVRMLTIPYLPYRDYVPYISHIRFSLNCCMVIFLCLAFRGRGWRRYASYGLAVWMVVFLFLVRSFTAMGVLTVASLVALLCFRRKWGWIVGWVAVVGTLATVVAIGCREYYTLTPAATAPLKATTANGRPYLHKQDGLVECGNYVNNYICLEELNTEWARRTGTPPGYVNEEGYVEKGTLIRYLNALGLTKDSAGVAALTDEQVKEIAAEVANPVQTHAWMGKRMLFSILFEVENYRRYHVVVGSSMLEHIELWRAAMAVIGKHPWAGTGTGDLHEAMTEELSAMQSPLSESDLLPHNEYLSVTALLGIPCFLLLLALFLRACPRLRGQRPALVLWTVAILVSFLTENTLDSLAGILFCTYFLAFRNQQCTNTTHLTTA